MGFFDWLKPSKPAEEKPRPDFSKVQAGSSSMAAPAAAPAAADRTHTVASGDSLWKIAKKHYGNGNRWQEIYEANRELIGSNPDRIHPGQVLRIPD